MNTILLIDDEVDLLELMSWEFKRENFNVLTASTVEQAIEIASSNDSIDYIISDLKLHNKSGVEIFETLEPKVETYKAFYFLSGYTGTDLESLKERGLTGIFIKPISTSEIIETLKAA